ncbi:MAG: hypothetical protein LAO31_13560 [Acidobacteriia bacterium]|nr:hypothetical protein [Terriglobia bacterium]
MPFEPVDDIPNIDEVSLNAKTIDGMMRGLVRLFVTALRNQYGVDEILKELLSDILFIFLISHTSIRAIVDRALRKTEHPLIADAMSLTREQVEKLFVIALLLDNPNKWITQYLRNSWRSNYEDYLLAKDELQKNLMFQEYINKHWPEGIEKMRRLPNRRGRGSKLIVSSFAMRAVKYKFNNPDSPKPTWFKRSGSVRDYLDSYFQFPTPGKAIRKIRNPNIQCFLRRWYKEYQFLCGYSHVALGKLGLYGMSKSKDFWTSEKLGIMAKRKADDAIILSYTATASSCVLVMAILSNQFGEKSNLQSFWKALIAFSLFAKAVWKIMPEKLLE